MNRVHEFSVSIVPYTLQGNYTELRISVSVNKERLGIQYMMFDPYPWESEIETYFRLAFQEFKQALAMKNEDSNSLSEHV